MYRPSVQCLMAVGLLAACGSGGDGALGAYTNGIVATSTTQENSCGTLPVGARWGDGFAALTSGRTNETCAAWAGVMTTRNNGADQATCLNRQVIVQHETYAGELTLIDGRFVDSECPPSTNSLTSGPRSLVGECLRRCNVTRDGMRMTLTCVDAVQPTRTLDTPWSLAGEADCEGLLNACPQNGDACTGAAICRGFMQDRASTNSGQFMFAWCAGGTLRLANAIGAL